MNWLTGWKKKIKIKVKQILKKRPTGEEEVDWENCPQCKKLTTKLDLSDNSFVCECSFHFDMPPKFRLNSLFDSGIYEIIEAPSNIDSESVAKEDQPNEISDQQAQTYRPNTLKVC